MAHSLVKMYLEERAKLPEDVAAAAMAPIAHYSLSVMFAQMPIDTLLAGVFFMQSLTYWNYQSGDKLWTKIIVILTTFMAAGITSYLWFFSAYLFVDNFGKWAPFTETNKLAPFPFIDAVNSAIVQSFFAHRAYLLLRRNLIVPIIVGLLILASLGATLAVLIIFSGLQAVAEADKVFVPELVWLTSIMAADMIITGSILWGLSRSKTGWANTDRTITKLIRMTLESQLPPTIIAIAFMAEFVHTPSSLLGAFLQGIQSKFYAIGLMYSLNARINFQQSITADGATAGGQVFALSQRGGPTQIQVDIETYVQDSYPAAYDKKGADSTSDINDNKASLGYGSQARLTDPGTTTVHLI